MQIALENAVDYITVLSQLKEARNKGLRAPVLLMGAFMYSILKSWPLIRISQDIIIPYWRMAKIGQYRMLLKPVQMDSLWLIFLLRRPLHSVKNAQSRSKFPPLCLRA